MPRVRVGRRALSAAAVAGSGAIALALYIATLAPAVMWYDMGEFATASSTLGIAHNTGYPLLILLGKAFTLLPIGDNDAYRVNLMSAVFTALAVALTASIIDDLTGDAFAACAGALTLAFAGTVWGNATWATSYGLNLCFLALVTKLMFAWHRDRAPALLVAAAFAFGLGMCNHRLIALAAPASLALVAAGRRDVSPRTTLLAAGAMALGLAVYAYLPIRGEQEPALSWARPAEWRTYASMFINGQTPASYWRLDIAERWRVPLEYARVDVTLAGLALAAIGVVLCAMRQRAIAAYLSIIVALDLAIVLTYGIHNVYNYLTPAYFAIALLIGIASAWIIEQGRSERSGIDIAPWLRVAVAGAAIALLPAWLAASNFARVDRGGDYAAHDFAHTTLERLPADAVVMTDSWTASPLWYAQLADGLRRDVLVSPVFSVEDEDAVAFAHRQIAAGRPVYTADGLRQPPASMLDAFTLQPVLVDGIEIMVTDALPKPRYRDALVMRGSLYRVLDAPPESTVPAVPAGAERDARLGEALRLVGFATDGTVADRGSVVQLTYYWRADAPITQRLGAVTLFADAAGRIATRDGWPLWQQARTIGENVRETPDWRGGEIVRESYFVLVPRGIAPGGYDIRVTVYDASSAAPPIDGAPSATVGRITVR